MTVPIRTIPFFDSATGRPLVHVSLLDGPQSGKTWYGYLQVADTDRAFPIIEGVLILDPAAASMAEPWLQRAGLRFAGTAPIQDPGSVDSFGFQWEWDREPRTEADLRWRVAERFGLSETSYDGKLILDAGCGAGTQSRWLLQHGAQVVGVDLSAAIGVAAQKLARHSSWTGIRGDLSRLPVADGTFDLVYCEGVIQHTQDSAETVKELWRVLKPGGVICATHYGIGRRFYQRVRHRVEMWHRRQVSGWDRYTLLGYAGFLAALGQIPLLGPVLKKTHITTSNPRMDNFKTNWCATYDNFGGHSFQRYTTPAEFESYFRAAGTFEILFASTQEPVLCLRKLT